MSVSFGAFVRRAREQAGLTQSRLAQLIGKSPTTIRSWEHGRTHPADPGAVTAMAAVLGLDENELLGQAGFEDSATAAGSRTGGLAPEEDSRLTATEPKSPGRASPILTDLLAVFDGRGRVADPVEADAPPPIQKEPAAITVVPATAPEPPAPDIPVEKPAQDARGPRTRIVVTQQPTHGTSLGNSNGYVGALSYVEDDTEKDFYRRRGAITAVVLIFMVVVVWWAFGRTGGAIADLIEGIVGSLDI